MLLIGLLLLAFACLALGLVQASAAWLLGSLAASVAAAVALWLSRDKIAARRRRPAARAGTPEPPARTPVPAAATLPGGSGERAARLAEGTAPGEVWVIDGQPHYHRGGCGSLTGGDAETVPHPQAVEDGFTACPTCRPDSEPDAGQLWVIDGRPRYHRQDCPIVTGQDAEPVPADQASEDGFLPCSLCEPDVTRG